MQVRRGSQSRSWLDRVLDRISPEPEPPPPPTLPPLDQDAWERSVDNRKVNTLTVREVGLIVFNETQSFSDSPDANDTINSAREKLAHAVMNGDLEKGKARPVTHPPIEPSARSLRNPAVRTAYDSSLSSARRAYLSLEDPTEGATHFQFLKNADRSNQKFGTPRDLPLKTQSGPFNNSYVGGDVPSRKVYVNTYERD